MFSAKFFNLDFNPEFSNLECFNTNFSILNFSNFQNELKFQRNENTSKIFTISILRVLWPKWAPLQVRAICPQAPLFLPLALCRLLDRNLPDLTNRPNLAPPGGHGIGIGKILLEVPNILKTMVHSMEHLYKNCPIIWTHCNKWCTAYNLINPVF